MHILQFYKRGTSRFWCIVHCSNFHYSFLFICINGNSSSQLCIVDWDSGEISYIAWFSSHQNRPGASWQELLFLATIWHLKSSSPRRFGMCYEIFFALITFTIYYFQIHLFHYFCIFFIFILIVHSVKLVQVQNIHISKI